jgi:hypothetical protein
MTQEPSLGGQNEPRQVRYGSAHTRRSGKPLLLWAYLNLGRLFGEYSVTWAANHGDRIIRRFERDIFPWIGGGRLPK